MSKLVRDNIPLIAPHRTFRTAKPEEVSQLVTDKVLEEAKELCSAKTRAEQIEELADVIEILVKFAEVNSIDWDELIAARKDKNATKGKFRKNWVLCD